MKLKLNHLVMDRFKACQRPFAIGTLLTLLSSLLGGVGIGLFIPLVGMLISENASTGFPSLDRLASGMKGSGLPMLPSIAGLIVVSLGLKNAFSYWAFKYSSSFQLSLMAELRKLAVEHLFRLPLTSVQGKKSSDLILILNKHSGQTALILEDLRFFLGHLFSLLIFLYLLMKISPELTAIGFVCLLLFWAPTRSFYRRMVCLGESSNVDAKAVSAFGLEMVNGFRLIKERARESEEMTRYHRILESFNITQQGTGLAREANRIVVELLGVFCLSILVASWHCLGQGEPAAFLSFLILYSRTLPPLAGIISQSGVFAGRLAGLRELSGFLTEAERAVQPTGSKPFTSFGKSLTFDNVSFTYPGRSDPALHNVSFELSKGRSLAIVGESGAGKSTLLTLIYGFNSPTSGRILVDGVPLQDIDMVSWRRHLGCVSQDTFLFNKSVRENVSYGADASEHSYRQALEASGSSAFVEALPERDATVIGERGVRLSGGQAQRLAIARAVIQNPELLILDEATSSLDSVTEREVQGALETLRQGRTSLTIAHRLSTIQRSDAILVLDKGRLAEQGTHVALMDKGGLYARLWKAQSHE